MFMWGYQDTFRILFDIWTKDVLSEARAALSPEALVIGVLRPASTDLPVCIEPEDGSLLESDFEGLLAELPERIENHPDQRLFYGDEPRRREQPEQIRRKATYEAVQNRLARADDRDGTSSLLGGSASIGNYDVFPVLRFQRASWGAQLALKTTRVQGHYFVHRSFLEGVATQILAEVTKHLASSDPGRFFNSFDRDMSALLRSSGRSLMYVPSWKGKSIEGLHGLFDHCNVISSFPYEGSPGSGRMIVARPDHPAVDLLVTFKNPVALRDNRWARKVLQLASDQLALVSDGNRIYGLGRLDDTRYAPEGEDAFIVEFVGHYKWLLHHAGVPLMRVEYGIPRLPSSRLTKEEFESAAMRVLEGASGLSLETLWRIVSAACEQKHGTMVVISSSAAAEVQRLAMQATPIQPEVLSDEIIHQVTGIDGAILLDPAGACHAIGVILDGTASPKGTPSRGSRYNSAIRYIDFAPRGTLAVVVSEDGQIDFIPQLMPRIAKSTIANLLSDGLEAVRMVDLDKLRHCMAGLDRFRFYLDEQGARTANQIRQEWDSVPSEGLKLIPVAFSGNPELDESFFLLE